MITLRWLEYEYYNIEHDMEAIRLQAITNLGTWYTDVDANEGLRESRKRFKQKVLEEVIPSGVEPGYVELYDEEAA